MGVLLAHLQAAIVLKLTASRRTQQAETNLQAYLKEKDPTFPNILHFLAQYKFYTLQK